MKGTNVKKINFDGYKNIKFRYKKKHRLLL